MTRVANCHNVHAVASLHIKDGIGKCHYFYFSTDCPNYAKFPSLKCAHISLWLNPTGHSKFHNTSNHPPPATDSGRTVRTPLYPPVQAVPLYSLPPFVSVTGVRYNSLLWMCALNTLTWPDLNAIMSDFPQSLTLPCRNNAYWTPTSRGDLGWCHWHMGVCRTTINRLGALQQHKKHSWQTKVSPSLPKIDTPAGCTFGIALR